jgi:hypothetical protein
MNAPAATASPATPASTVKRAGLIAAFVALLVITWLPGAAGLPAAGQVMLAVLAFAVIVWMTEALDYAVSAVVIGALMIFLLAYVPDAAKPGSADMGPVPRWAWRCRAFPAVPWRWWRRPASSLRR